MVVVERGGGSGNGINSNTVLNPDWATVIVPVASKNGKIRICSDHKITANTALNIDDYLLPKIEDIFASLEREHLPNIDLKKAYLQVLVNSNS